MNECPGHFGVIKLAEPVFHYGFMNKVKKILECICHNCGRIKATEVITNHPIRLSRSANIRVER